MKIDIDIRKYKITLVGDGYTYDEVKHMSDEKAEEIFKSRLKAHMSKEYSRSVVIIKDVLGKDILDMKDLLW